MSMLQHSAKGKTWNNHKYIRKEGNRYIYKESANAGIFDALKNHQKNQKESYENTKKNEEEFHQNIKKQVDDYLSSTRFMQIMETPFVELPDLIHQFAAEDKQKKEQKVGKK